MIQGELRSIVFATIAAVILAPLLGRLLSRLFPPRAEREDDENLARHRLRNQVIEYAGVGFFIVGIAVPFVLQRTDRLQPTTTNITLILSLGLLFMVGGTTALSALLGDRNAESFLAYFEHERRISRTAMRRIARVIVAASVAALIALLFFNR
jgi:hypothetical protein